MEQNSAVFIDILRQGLIVVLPGSLWIQSEPELTIPVKGPRSLELTPVKDLSALLRRRFPR